MAKSIAVIGNLDSIEYFRVLGCETYETEKGELTEEQFLEIVERKFKIILVTEEVFRRHVELFRKKISPEMRTIPDIRLVAMEIFHRHVDDGRRIPRTFPVVSVIPDVRGAVWKDGIPVSGGTAFEELRRAVIRAVGQDISSIEER
ncbi:MAG: hypothetical protein KAX38_04825 [Candidatus Krumholzibacteria bacterium]|nr:hypothetical protein [Candidatus Krumholzibacteria bacterium]